MIKGVKMENIGFMSYVANVLYHNPSDDWRVVGRHMSRGQFIYWRLA